MKMKMGLWVLLLVTVMLLNLSSPCSAWFGFGNKHKPSRNSVLPAQPSIIKRTSHGSSIVIPLYGNVYPVGFYNVTLSIGQPPRSYFLDVDTGSDLTWLQCDAPCTHCSETPHPLYKPSNDFVACKDPLCASLQPSDDYECENPDQCDYQIDYADQYSTLGALVNDVYLLNFTNDVQLKVRMALGCGYDQTFSPSYHPLDGILGLGRGKTSLVSQLNGQGLVQNVVGHCLSSLGGGYVFFGNVYGSFRVSWTPMSPTDSKHYSAGPAELAFGGKKSGAGTLTALFDTGSSYTYFNSKAYKTLISWLKKELHKVPLNVAADDQTLPICWRGKKPIQSIREVKRYFKSLALTFSNGGKVKTLFEIPLEGYLILSNMGNVCLGILNGSEVGLGDLNIIGDISMQDKVIVFDNEKHLIGWAHADCTRPPRSRAFSISSY
ncbi:hypothetical protein PIB30_065099 [Stylosanthes scabra]|uniref:Peptidase A1 domain-containing protein n=1 Tax=Stylosanthes scabra TaxID=79078 RepID=A0ABU6VKY2_9FABA|nr:hypothetical protein [Stylosanthes scabra]